MADEQKLIEAVEGIVVASAYYNGKFYYADDDVYGDSDLLPYGHVSLSKSYVESLDLVSEGPIKGFVTGRYSYSGNLGEVGWRTANCKGYISPSGYTNAQYLRSIYWNDVPVMDDYGKLNFSEIDISHSLGTPDGNAIQTLSPYQKATRTIGERVYAGSLMAKTYRIMNPKCIAIVVNVKITALAKTDDSSGNVMRRNIIFTYEYRPIFKDEIAPWKEKGAKEVNLWGKITQPPGFIRGIRINFDESYIRNENLIGWEIRITKTYPAKESVSSFDQHMLYVDSITEIQSSVFSYPYSSVVRSQFSAEYFSSIPQRSFELELLKVKVPKNYNTTLRTYATVGDGTTNGAWDGTFKDDLEWTNNPAWCFYDLITNQRYGLGKYIDAQYVDKWTLYEIAKYCDTLVSDGEGGLEPRFTCNLILMSREEAFDVLNNMASVFRALVYYANGQINVVQDAPKNPIVAFTNANVENGDFTYASTSKKDRHSIAIVRYNDPRDMYKPAVEYVEDIDSIRKYGVRELDMTAFGCTSRGQAIRFGRWALLSENTETETISFSCGLDGGILRPGDIFAVSDSFRKAKRHGGRLLNYSNIGTTGASLQLDNKIYLENNIHYELSVITPSYQYNSTQVTGLDSSDYTGIRKNFIQKFYFSGLTAVNTGNTTILGVSGAFNTTDYTVTGNPIWFLELSPLDSNYTGAQYFTTSSRDYYRTISIKELDANKFEVIGLQYNVDKYVEIESGFGVATATDDYNNVPASPYNLILSETTISEDDPTTPIVYSFNIDDTTYINSYKIYATTGTPFDSNVPDSDYICDILPKGVTTEVYYPTSTGNLYMRVYSSNDVRGLLSAGYAEASIEVMPPEEGITSAMISSIGAGGDYQTPPTMSASAPLPGNTKSPYVTVINNSDSAPIFTWQAGFNDIYDEQIRYRVTVRNTEEIASRIPNPNILYEETGIADARWQYTLEKNIASSGGPWREYQVVVEIHDEAGNTSAGNIVGQPDTDNWGRYPNGYDIINFYNPRQTGIELGNNLKTYTSGTGYITTEEMPPTGGEGGGPTYEYTDPRTGEYVTVSNIGANGELTIQYISGSFNNDIVGGFIYISDRRFPKLEAKTTTGYWSDFIQKSRFDFDPNVGFITQPVGAFNVRGAPKAYVSLSFFDELDKKLLEGGVDISQNLYVSNNAEVWNDAAVGTLTIGGVTLATVSASGEIATGDEANYVGTDGTIILKKVMGMGAEATTMILYMAPSKDNVIPMYTGVAAVSGAGGGGKATRNKPYYKEW